MKLQQAISQIRKMPEHVRHKAIIIIAEKGTAYFKERFTQKNWNSVPWPNVKKQPKRGTLMLRSGKLMSTIRPVEVSATRVRIRAGSPQVPYAQIHNEGGVINHPGGTPYFFSKKQNTAIFVSKEKAASINAIFKHPLPLTGPHKIPMPKRQFIGYSPHLGNHITTILAKAKLLSP
jgi:phage gpG-like protein